MHPRHFARSRPDHPAMILADTGAATSYAELEAKANQGAQLLRALGLATGDTVALYVANGPEYLNIFWAGQRCGLHVVPVPTRLTAGEAAYIVNDSGARLLFVSPDLPGSAGLAAREAMPNLTHAYAVGGAIGALPSWEEARSAMPDTPVADEVAGTHMPYSSGTTGRPKGLRLPLAGGPADGPHPFARATAERWDIAENSIYLSPAPLYHSAPLVWCFCVQRLGGTVILMSKFDPEAFLAAIERYRVTVTQVVPTMFVRLLKLPPEVRSRYDLSSLTQVIHAAAPCPVPVKREMIAWLGPIIDEYYGASEGHGGTMIGSTEWLAKPGSVGRASVGSLHICDDAGHELPVGSDGLVYFGGGLAIDYHGDATKSAGTRNPLRPDLATVGDIGHVDADGYLFLSDRKDFMIISGGVNVYPQETENELILHPAVADAAVFGVPDADLGEAVKAVVQPADWDAAGPALESELIAWLRGRLSAVKCPKSIDFEPALPRHDTGKLFKKPLRDRYWANAG